MQHSLAHLDSFVRNNLSPSAFKHQGQSQGFESTLGTIKSSIAYLCSYMLDKGSEIHNAHEFEVFVNHYSRTVLTLFETLSGYCTQSRNTLKGTIREKYRSLIRETCLELEDFLAFMQATFGKYFDDMQPIPFTVADAARKQFRRDIRSLDSIFRLPGIDQNTVNFALHPVRCFIQHNKGISYKDLKYYSLIIKVLSGIVEQKPDDPNFELHNILFSINFNSQDYIRYCIRQLHRKFGKLPYAEQLERFNWYIKSMKQVARIKGLSFLHNHPPAIDQMQNYIDQEIYFIQTLLKLEKGIIDGVPVMEANKILTGFSVPQLAAIFKAFFESGGLPYKSMAEAMRYFPSHFSTVGTVEIGEESFKSRVHNLEKAAVGQGIAFFLKCIEVLRKYQ